MAIALDPRYVVELQPLRPSRPARSSRPLPGRSAPAHRARSAAPSRSALVYRRRRSVLAATVASVVVLAFLGGRAVLADEGGVALRPTGGAAIVPADQMPAVYLVQPGDTLWAIAERFSGDTSVGSYVDALVTANGGASIQAGQELVLP